MSESITRLESLLLIASNTMAPHLNQVEEAEDDKMRTNRAKHLARVATEYRQLLYHVSKAEEKSCKFVEEIQWVISQIQDHVVGLTDLNPADRPRQIHSFHGFKQSLFDDTLIFDRYSER